MKYLLITLSILISANVYAATAYFTGNFEYVTTVTGRTGVQCEYYYAGQTFYQVFAQGYCPTRVEVY